MRRSRRITALLFGFGSWLGAAIALAMACAGAVAHFLHMAAVSAAATMDGVPPPEPFLAESEVVMGLLGLAGAFLLAATAGVAAAERPRR